MYIHQTINNYTPVTGSGAQLFKFSTFILDHFIRDSRLTVSCLSTGQRQTIGQGKQPEFRIVVDTPSTLWSIVKNPDPDAGELFMDHKWDMESGDIGAFITMMARNLQGLMDGPCGFIFRSLLRHELHLPLHDIAKSKHNVQRHYDIGNDLYEKFLDEGMNYSCAFFDGLNKTLREAQLNKLRTTIERLGIEPNMKVLDIGCGWGEATRLVARETGATDVTGITLSENQIAIAKERASTMSHAPVYELEDYRQHADTHPEYYDRIFSIGMFEHVGADQYRTYFSTIKRQLAPKGRALIHSITTGKTKPGSSMNSQWLDRHIFPGGVIPDLSEMLDAARLEGLRPSHAPYLQPPSDYAQTLRHWRANFLRSAVDLDKARYDERFGRMWIYYLALCEAMFDGCAFQVAQVVFEKAA